MLAGLVYMTRHEGEMPRQSDAAAWVGMPGFEAADENVVSLVVSFETAELREQFLATIGFQPHEHRFKNMRRALGIWWPFREHEDLVSLRFQEEDTAA
jgi:hypothetical protein